jgi:hypothetical protein
MPHEPVRSRAAAILLTLIGGSAAVQARTADDWTMLGGPPMDVCPGILLEGERAMVAHPELRGLPFAGAFDLDGDGREEILAPTGTESPTILRLRSSATRVALPEVLPAAFGADVLFGVDLDGDGDQDLVQYRPGSAIAVAVQFNDGTGTLSPGWSHAFPEAADDRQMSIRRRPDGGWSLVLPRGPAGTTVLDLDAGGQPAGVSAMFPEPAQLAVVLDVNGDGIDDVLTAPVSAPGMRLRLGLPDGGFEVPTPVALPTSESMIGVADLDEDGCDDVIVVRVFGSADRLRIHRGRRDGSFATPIVLAGRSEGVVFRPITGDVDGDGILDVLVHAWIGNTGGRVEIFRGDGRGGVVFAAAVPTEAFASSALADLDGDGRRELVSLGGERAVVHRAGADSPDGLPGSSRSLPGVRVEAFVDVDGDGGAELVERRPAADGDAFDGLRVRAWDGRGAGVILAETSLDARPDAVVAAPVDRAGGPPRFLVRLTDEAGGRTARTGTIEIPGAGIVLDPGDLPLPGELRATGAGDFDGDGDTDILVQWFEQDTIGFAERIGDRFVIGEPIAAAAGMHLFSWRPLRLGGSVGDPGDAADDVLVLLSRGDDPESFGVVLIAGQPGGPMPAPAELAPDRVVTGRLRSPLIADWEGDGDQDVLIGGRDFGVLLRQSPGAGLVPEFVTYESAGGFAPQFHGFGDVNGDGVADAVGRAVDVWELREVVAEGVDGRDGPRLRLRAVATRAEGDVVAIVDLDGDGRGSVVRDSPLGVIAVTAAPCPPDPCLGDLDADGVIDFDDLLQMLGPIDPEIELPGLVWDLDGDGDRDGDDVFVLLGNWGSCADG